MSGTVWNDKDIDGLLETVSESGIDEVTVTAKLCLIESDGADKVLRTFARTEVTTTTNTDGSWSLSVNIALTEYQMNATYTYNRRLDDISRSDERLEYANRIQGNVLI